MTKTTQHYMANRRLNRELWQIEDWTGKVCFHGKTFESFEDAWAFIREREPEDAWQEYYVEKAGGE